MMTDYDRWAKLEAELSDADDEPDELAEKVKALREASRSVNALRELRLAGDDEHLAEDAPPLGAQYKGASRAAAPVLGSAAAGPRATAGDGEARDHDGDACSAGILSRAAAAVPSNPEPAAPVSPSMPPPAPPTKAQEKRRDVERAALVESKPLDGRRWDKLCDDHLSGEENTPSKFSQLSTISQSFDQMRTDRLARRARWSKYYDDPDPALVAEVRASMRDAP